MAKDQKTCPCGSGKPYAECCGIKGGFVLLEQVKWRRAGKELRRKLGEFADQPSLSWDAARAQDMYFSSLEEKHLLQEDEFTMERCFEWYIFDFHVAKGAPIIEKFYKELGRTLNYREKQLLEGWLQARISLYEVLEVFEGQGLVIRDLLRGEKIVVRDTNAAAEIGAGNLLLIRTLKIGGEYEFSTSGLALPDWCKSALLNKLTADREHFYKKRQINQVGWEIYLKERSHKINSWVMELGRESTSGPGELAGLSKEQPSLTFPLKDWQKVLAGFRKSRACQIVSENRDRRGNLEQVVVAWLGDGRGPGGLRAVRGQFMITKRYLVVLADSPKSLMTAKSFYLENFAAEVTPAGEKAPPAEEAAEAAAEAFSWPAPGYAAVALRVKEGLAALGFDHKQQRGAIQLWFDYCSKEQPAIRKAAVWTATVIYAFTRLEKQEELKQQDLACQYGVSSSTISNKYKQLCRSLELVAYDKRYTTKIPSTRGYRGNR